VTLSPDRHEVVAAACERLIPGSAAAGVVVYIEGLLGAFDVSPPRIWAVAPRGSTFHDLSPFEEIAWRRRLADWQARYDAELPLLGDDFAAQSGDEQDARLRAHPALTSLLYEHACEGMYGAPAYGGNRELTGWRTIGFEGDVAPLGYSDDEVALP
jgi:gluconate 2-dehydrogenase gamma chain